MRTLILGAAATLALAGALSACQQNTAEEPARSAEASGTDADVTINPPDNVTVVQPDTTPDVKIDPPDVNINPPDVDVDPPGGTTTKESTTVTVPGVGSHTTTVEKRD